MQTQSKLVIKPLFGSQGKGVRLVDKTHLPLPMDCFVDGVFYLQEWLAAPHDYRVFVVNGQVLAAMKRTGEDWLHNVAQGARCEQTDEPDVLAIALQASSVLEIAYCGVDVIRDENGQLSVLEVNSIPAWRGLQSVAEVDVAQALVDDFLSQMNQKRRVKMNSAARFNSAQLSQAFKNACMAELAALKPGNVHIFADGHGMTVQDFVASADAAASVIAKPECSLGQRIFASVQATQRAVTYKH